MVVEPEFVLDVEDDWYNALEKLLGSLELLHLKNAYYAVGYFFKFEVEHLVWAIYHNLCQTRDGRTLVDFVAGFFQKNKRKLEELAFKDICLLLWVFNLVNDVPDHLANGLADSDV